MNTTFTGDATNRWITAMKDEAFDEVEEAVIPATESSKLNHSMAAVIDRLFDNFKRYSFEYNRTQDDREFEINCERPASMRTSAEYLELGKPIKYCLGHLASRHWAMVIQGEDNRILVYITPVEYLVGFRPSPSEFPPHMEMRLVRDTAKSSREFVWSIGGQPLSQDSLPVLARRLFTQLVKVTKGEANYGELFALSPQEEKLALAQQSSGPIDRSFEDEDSSFLGQKKPDLSERTFVVAAEQVELLTAAMGEISDEEDAPTVSERPPFNAMLSPSTASSLSASSSYPQVAAAIANGEPKALNTPTDAPTFPRSQSMSEQAETFPKLPAPDPVHMPAPNPISTPAPAPAMAPYTPAPPAMTFVAQPANLSDDDAIAALIFPAPPDEQPAETAPESVSLPPPPAPAPQAPQPSPPAAAPEAAAPTPAPQYGAQSASSPWVGPNGEPARVPTPSRTSIEMNTLTTRSDNGEGAKNNGQSSLEKETAEANTSIAQSLKGLFDSVDHAINGLTAVGMAAMHADDLNTVSAVMKQTKSLKTFRDSVVALSKDWQKAND